MLNVIIALDIIINLSSIINVVNLSGFPGSSCLCWTTGLVSIALDNLRERQFWS